MTTNFLALGSWNWSCDTRLSSSQQAFSRGNSKSMPARISSSRIIILSLRETISSTSPISFKIRLILIVRPFMYLKERSIRAMAISSSFLASFSQISIRVCWDFLSKRSRMLMAWQKQHRSKMGSLWCKVVIKGMIRLRTRGQLGPVSIVPLCDINKRRQKNITFIDKHLIFSHLRRKVAQFFYNPMGAKILMFGMILSEKSGVKGSGDQ